MILSKCALCGKDAELMDLDSSLVQCTNYRSRCGQSADGRDSWNANQKIIAKLKKDSRFLDCLKPFGIDKQKWYGEVHKAAYGDGERVTQETLVKLIELKSNGDIYVKGRLAENDREVVDALREWATHTNLHGGKLKIAEEAEDYAATFGINNIEGSSYSISLQREEE